MTTLPPAVSDVRFDGQLARAGGEDPLGLRDGRAGHLDRAVLLDPVKASPAGSVTPGCSDRGGGDSGVVARRDQCPGLDRAAKGRPGSRQLIPRSRDRISGRRDLAGRRAERQADGPRLRRGDLPGDRLRRGQGRPDHRDESLDPWIRAGGGACGVGPLRGNQSRAADRDGSHESDGRHCAPPHDAGDGEAVVSDEQGLAGDQRVVDRLVALVEAGWHARGEIVRIGVGVVHEAVRAKAGGMRDEGVEGIGAPWTAVAARRDGRDDRATVGPNLVVHPGLDVDAVGPGRVAVRIDLRVGNVQSVGSQAAGIGGPGGGGVRDGTRWRRAPGWAGHSGIASGGSGARIRGRQAVGGRRTRGDGAGQGQPRTMVRKTRVRDGDIGALHDGRW